MLRKGLILATIGIAVSGIASFSIFVSGEESAIPEWVKNNAGWWSEGAIGESDYVSSLQYLISQGIIKIPITEVAAATTEIFDRDRAKSFAVHFILSDEKFSFYTFQKFAHFSQSIPNTISGTPAANYFGAPQFQLEGLPTKDKKQLYQLISDYIKPGATERSFDISVDVVTGDGSVLQTWDYRKCLPSGYWIYVEESKDVYMLSGEDEMEIREYVDFKCGGFSLNIP